MPHPEPVVLILAPLGRDAMVAATILAEVGIASKATSTLDDLVAHLDHAACAVMTEEALLHWDRQEIARWVEQQPPWSDFPFVLLSYRGGPPDVRLTDLLGNVTVLERPFHPAVLANAVRSALRARRRQREVQAYLEERQRTHERQALLIRELHHRVKNTLATVQGLLGATARSTKDVDTFYQSFSDRIVSLGKTHNLLTEDYWQTAPLRDLLQNELGHYNDGTANRITLEGPPVELAADLAVPTGMAIHELTTNATKYGRCRCRVDGSRSAGAWINAMPSASWNSAGLNRADPWSRRRNARASARRCSSACSHSNAMPMSTLPMRPRACTFAWSRPCPETGWCRPIDPTGQDLTIRSRRPLTKKYSSFAPGSL